MEALSKLGIHPLLLIAQIVNFVILLWLLRRFLYKPLLKLFQNRTAKIQEGIKTAEDLKRQAQEAESQQKKNLDEARKEAHRIIEQATILGDDEKKKILEMAKNEAKKIVEKTMVEIEDEKKNIMKEIRKEIGEMVVTLSTVMIRKTIDKKTQKQLLEESIREVEKELEKIKK
jgi:F-type H+-transporting ATPase subunit b